MIKQLPVFLYIFLLIIYHPLAGQENTSMSLPDSILYELEPITVTASRFPVKQDKLPFAITPLDNTHLTVARQQLSVHESLSSLPGVFVMNANNFAQDLRLAIRGFGARAAFGIRGIKVLIDGIPETTPDGQTQLDNLNLAVIDQAEILRGPVSTLYGNSSGGVLQFSSSEPPDEFMIKGRLAAGSFGYRGMYINAGQSLEDFGYLISASTSRIKGYRDHSAMKNFLLNGNFKYRINSQSETTMRLSYENSPDALDAGSLNLEQAKQNPKQAYSGNVTYNAGEKVSQGRIGITYSNRFSQKHKIQTVLYYTRRIFSNRLPFESGGMVELNRHYAGLTATYDYTSLLWGMDSKLVSGFDLAAQKDDRKRFDNLQGTTGNLTFDQDENYSNLGIFLQHHLQINSRWLVNYGLRHDAVRVSAKDKFARDVNNSSEKIFTGWSIMGGAVFNCTPQNNIYANISSGFETPALIELSSNPDGQSGFNPNLDPQKSINIELGFRGILFEKVRYELSAFSIRVSDEILPYELEQTPGRTYYRNAGKSRHRGLEVQFSGNPYSFLNLTLNYTFSNFDFVEYKTTDNDYQGNQIPGIPRDMFNTILTFFTSGRFFQPGGTADTEWVLYG